MPAGRPETSQTLDRGLRVLSLLAQARDGLSINDLAASLGVSRTVVYRLLTTLEAHDLVRRDSEGMARLGFGVARLAGRVHPLLRRAALPVLRRLADDVGATAHLTIAEGEEAVAVAVVEPSRTDYHVAYREGARHPLGRGAAGRAIGAAAEANSGIASGGSGERAGGTVGYVVSHGELQAGAWGIAARLPSPVPVVGSVGVVALSALDEAVVGARVIEAAADLARALRA
ncbi:MAG: helix-turn-helix domain-containing protein [Candidatus Nanopelagicales bacterium]